MSDITVLAGSISNSVTLADWPISGHEGLYGIGVVISGPYPADPQTTTVQILYKRGWGFEDVTSAWLTDTSELFRAFQPTEAIPLIRGIQNEIILSWTWWSPGNPEYQTLTQTFSIRIPRVHAVSVSAPALYNIPAAEGR